MKQAIKRAADRIRDYMAGPAVRYARYTRPDAASQLALALAYRKRLASGETLPSLEQVGFQAYSQTDEDGILWYLLALTGNPARQCVEICCGDGIECNSANLIINHGWHALLVDGDERKMKKVDLFYASHQATYVFPPRLVNCWVSAENVNDVISSNGFSGDIGVLTIDVDGMDYWLWKAIDCISPQVVVTEFCTALGPDPVCTVPYRADFNAWEYSVTAGMPDYAGASLRACVALGEEKGYRFVGVNRHAFNAFFVRKDLCPDQLVSPSVESCFARPWARWSMETRGPKIKGYDWTDL